MSCLVIPIHLRSHSFLRTIQILCTRLIQLRCLDYLKKPTRICQQCPTDPIAKAKTVNNPFSPSKPRETIDILHFVKVKTYRLRNRVLCKTI
jgi:hypothetical protein